VIELHPRMIPRLISGQRFRACGQSSSARVHIILCGASRQCTSMCSMDSVTLHFLQNSRHSLVAMWCQNLPTFWVPCMALYRNCLTRVRRVRCCIPDQIDSSVLSRPLYSWSASLVRWMFSEVVALSLPRLEANTRLQSCGSRKGTKAKLP
jgi:hypothetical protein